MPHLASTSTSSHRLQGVTFTPFVNTAGGARDLAAWQVDIPARTPGAPHTMSEEEVLHVLTGAVDVGIDDERFTARAGDAILVPAGALFQLSNTTDEPARAWVTTLIGMNAVLAGERFEPPWAQ
ncbi:cupin domain-containing protein [Planctomonas sp. JC2975]|uniref:cupin domain-containing protein n=1 Tax=Planctomonas sp. JC2975 TaxID=2729626 RepID=UPI0014748F8B|nr:cupin domain-containing protein [Planctomonas sp. JC2975]NNC12490.1 cupin domain-containing protein [Planctomonas sp. JC2975]